MSSSNKNNNNSQQQTSSLIGQTPSLENLVHDLQDLSEDELIALLGASLSPAAKKAVAPSTRSKKQVKASRKVCKVSAPRSKRLSLKIPKWRSVEPTSFIDPALMSPNEINFAGADVADDYPVLPPLEDPIPLHLQAMDLIEDVLLRVTRPNTDYRERLLLCIDFDTPISPPHFFRIRTIHLEFLASSFSGILQELRNIMPVYFYRAMAMRHMEIIAAAHAKKQLKFAVNFRSIRRFTKHYEKWLFRLSFNYLFDRQVFPVVEPTSRITSALSGIGASIFAGYSFYKAGAGDDNTISRFIANWAMQGITVIQFGRFLDWILWIFAFINIFVPLHTIATDLFSLVEKLLAKLPSFGFGPQQFTSGRAVEPTSLTEVFAAATTSFSSVASNVGTIATVLSVFVVCVSSLMLGLNIREISNAEGIATKFVKAGVVASKGKSGLYAIIAMIGDLKPWIEQALSSVLLTKFDDTFTSAILACDIDDTPTLKKEEIFKHVEYLVNPMNYLTINQRHDEQVKLSWVHSVLSRVLETNAKNSTLSTSAVQLITKYITELNKVRSAVYRYVKDEDTRFVPFWINIFGLAGTRKSTFMSRLAKTLIEALRRLGKYEVTGSNNIYSVNFTDKYMTGYKQEMCVLIDDIFQDASPLGDRSSALDIISWVSNIPHHTNQAALDDKGLPFTSKIIISTSNVPPSALHRKEIVSNEALKRRMKFAIEFEFDPNTSVDPMLGERIRIYKLNPLGSVTDKTSISNARELCSLILKEYIDWYDLQQQLILQGGADDACVERMISDLGLTPSSQSSSNAASTDVPFDIIENDPTVEPTSLVSWWNGIFTSLGGSPPYIIHENGIEQFDTRYHPDRVEINRLYYRYAHDQCPAYGVVPKPLLNFHEAFVKRHREIQQAQEQLSNGTSLLQKCITIIKERPLWQYLGVSLGLLVAYKWFTSGPKGQPEATAIQYDYGKPVRAPPKIAKVVTPTSGVMDAYREDFTVSGTDANAMDLVLTSLIGKGGISRLVVPLEDGRCETAVAVRVGGTSILANHHVFAKFKEGQEFVIEIPHYLNAMKPVKQKFARKRLVRIGSADACVYKCDSSMPCAKNLVRHFSTDAVKIKSTNAIIATRNPEAMYVSNVIASPVVKPLSYCDESGKVEYSTLGSYEVSNYVTTKGMSGSLLVALDPYNPKKLLGIQTSRNTHSKAGYFQPITESMLLEALEGVGEDLSSTPADREFIAEACSITYDTTCPPNIGKQSLIYLGTLDRSSRIQFQKKSKLCPSLVQDESSLTKAPAALDKYDSRLCDEVFGKDLMYKNIEGYDTASYGSLDLTILDEVTEMLAAEYACKRSVPGITRRLLDDFEMVNGIPGKINAIDMTTSPGYPYVKQRKLTGVNGKYEWFDESTQEEDGRKVYTPKPILMDQLNLRETAAQSGARVESVAYACLKDETRPLPRVENGITRIFICLPMDYNLLIRKYFGMYTATQHALAGRIPSSVGIDPVTGWKGLYNRLRSKGDHWEDFDYKNWDQFLHPEFVKRYASIVNRWYGDSDDSSSGKVRLTLMSELVYTYLIVGAKMFLKTGGQCSGCAITAEINCDIHDIIMFYVFYVLAKEQGSSIDSMDDLLTFYRDNVELALYGDDIVKSATSHVTEWFNGKTIAPLMTQIGMKITPADKESTDFVIKKPEEVTFLKRGFKPDPVYPERYVRAPLELKTIWNIPQWIKSCDDKERATRVNCEMALREMYMYGEANFNNARNYLNKRIEMYNMIHPGAEIRPLTLTYSGMEKAYEEGTLEICYPKGWFDTLVEPNLVE